MPSVSVSHPSRRLALVLFVVWLPIAGCAVHAGETGMSALTTAATVPPPAPGHLHAVLLNGGSRKEINYQSHLHHIRRALELLRTNGVPPANIAIFSADGSDPAPDLATRETNDERGFWVLPQWTQNLLQPPITYVDSTVDGAKLQPATKDALRGWLTDLAQRLKPGDTLLFYVTDHGDRNANDEKDNTIALWGEKLSVTELREMLTAFDPGVRVVMLMSQCFSGSFANVVRFDAGELPEGNVCGYFSTTAARPAYGCYPENRGKDGIGHSYHFLESVAALDRFPAAERSVLITDRTPDIPNSTLDVFLAARLTKAAAAAHRELPALADELLAEAWKDRGAWEPDIRLLDKIGASFGTFSPRSLGELEEQARVLPEFSSRLATYADRWNQAYDALKIENLREFAKLHPEWKTRFSDKSLQNLDAGTRRKELHALLAQLVPFTNAEPARLARLKVLKRKAADASAASYRAEVRLGAVLRLRTLLTSMAGRVYMATRATPDERAAFERLTACQDLALGGTAGTTVPAALASDESFPPLAEERRLVEELMPAYMGIYFRPVDEEQRKRWSTTEGAVVVMNVTPDSPAATAGLASGDVILGPPDAPFTEPTQVREWTMRSEIGVAYELDTLRDGAHRAVTLRPGPYPLDLPELPGPPKVGSAAPTMDLKVVRGEDSLSKERPDLLFFWATWCVICKQSVPETLTLAKERGLDVIAVTDEDPELVKKFLADYKEPFPEVVAIDPHRVTFQGYGVSGTPTFVIVDPDATVQFYQTGYSSDGGLHVDGFTYNGRKRAAILSPERATSPKH